MESYSIKAVLEAQDTGFAKGFAEATKSIKNATSSLDGVTGPTEKATSSFKSMVGAIGLVKVASVGFNVLKNSVSGAVSRFDTLNKYPVVMKSLGYSTKDVNSSMKTLTKGIEGLPTSLDEVVSTSQRFASITGDVDTASKATIALNDAFLASGASGVDASRGLDQYTQMLSSGKVDMTSWKTLQETMPASLAKVAKSFGLTGKSAQNDLYKKLQSGEITMDQLNNKFIELDGGVNGFADMAKKNSAGIGTSFTNLANATTKGLANMMKSIDKALNSAGLPNMATMIDSAKDTINAAFAGMGSAIEQFLPPMINAVKQIVDFAKSVGDTVGQIAKFVEQNDLLKVGLVAIGAAVTAIVAPFAALKGATMAMSIAQKAWTTAVSTWSAVTKAATAVQAAFNAVMNANPLSLIVIAIIAVVAALVYFLTQTKTGQKIWGNFVKFITTAWQGVMDFFSGLGEWFSQLWQGIVDTATNIWNSFSEFMAPIVETIQNIWNGFVEFFSGVWNGLVLIVSTVLNLIVTAVTTYVNLVVTFWSTAWNILVTVITTIWNVIVTVITTVISAVVTVITTYVNMIVTFWTTVWNVISAVISTVWNAMSSAISSVLNVIKSVISNVMNGIKTVFSTVWNAIKTVVTNVVNGIKSVITSVFNSVKGFISNVWNGIKGITSSVWNGIKSVVSGVVNGIKSVVTNTWNGLKSTVSGIWKGIQNAIEGPIKAAKKTVDNVVKGIKNVLGGVGKAVNGAMDGLKGMVGLKSMPAPDVPNPAGLTAPVAYAFDTPNPDAFSGGTGLMGKIADVSNSLKNNFSPKISSDLNITNELETTGIQNKIDGLIEAIKDKNDVIVLDDGTLIGKIAPEIDNNLGKRTKHSARYS